jgi:putative membrane protein
VSSGAGTERPDVQPDPTERPGTGTDTDTDTDTAGWSRLDVRVIVAFPLRQAGALVPLVGVLLVGGSGQGGWHLLSALAPVLVVLMLGGVRWATVRYRVDDERVELRGGLLAREHRAVRRDRVRTVDLRANLAHRLCGLTAVDIGTGSGGGKEGRLSLDGVTVAEGERLRRELLRRAPSAAAEPAVRRSGPSPSRTPSSSADPARPRRAPRPGGGGVEVARLRASWLRYAPFTASGLVAVAAIVGAAFRVAGDLGVDLADWSALHTAGDEFTTVPLWVGVTVLALAVLAVAGLGSLALYLEGWWDYRLTRETDDTLRLRRGLLTTRSLSLEQARIRGAEVTEPLALRLVGGARCAAVTTGLDEKSSGRGALSPPAPVAEAHRVAAAALRLADPVDGTAAALVRHPPAALRRRITRAVTPAVGLAALAEWGHDAAPWLAWTWPAAVLLVPAGALLGADRYRNLGHALRREHLVIGSGSLVRRRVALQRRGVIGWRMRQSPLQRRAGLVTLDAVTAAGNGRYSLVDLTRARAVSLVEQTTPGLLPRDL